jgi:leucyl/phenylalanyl-tRNA--protein transferase
VDEDGNWIDDEIVESYCALHARGFAHSVETWQEGTLVGGLYGVAIQGAFFGESMFHRVTDASKIALIALVERLRGRGYALLDTQWVTEHLAQFGAVEIPRRRYLRLLEEALRVDASFS